MSRPAAELHPCKCGCGTMVPGTWARGHWAKKQAADKLRLTPLPGPDVADDDLELHLDLPEPPPGWGPADEPDLIGPEHAAEPIETEEPKPIGWPPAGGGQRRPQGRVRVTATVRRDITAKIKMPLFIGGKIWEARDPLCGGVFVKQADPIAGALTDIVCDSADLVAWFTGPAGGFMKYLNLGAALAPVGQMVWAHHIAHTAEPPRDGQQPPQPDMTRYAA